MASKYNKTLILGLGNTILSDDGIGIYVARALKKEIKDSAVCIQEASLGGIELLEPMVGYNKAILIDSMAIPEKSYGDVVKVDVADLKGGSAMARHQIPFKEALDLGYHLQMDLPEEIVIYGINVKDTVTFGEECTPEVASQIHSIINTILTNEFQY